MSWLTPALEDIGKRIMELYQLGDRYARVPLHVTVQTDQQQYVRVFAASMPHAEPVEFQIDEVTFANHMGYRRGDFEDKVLKPFVAEVLKARNAAADFETQGRRFISLED